MANPSCTKPVLNPLVEENLKLQKTIDSYTAKGFKPIKPQGNIKPPKNVILTSSEDAFIDSLKKSNLKGIVSQKQKDKTLFLFALDKNKKEVSKLEINDLFYAHKNAEDDILSLMSKMEHISNWLESISKDKSVEHVVLSKTGYFWIGN